jgi:UDP-GlcNAc:undecaprenyl-phosphate/decaprenyl-phosphate GlcNAc-1-phosphate transferase
LFTIICLLGFTNAINMADGKNNIVIGMCIIWTTLLIRYVDPALHPILFALLAALVVMFWFNARSKVFLGDAGSYGLATLVGLFVIHAYHQGQIMLPADTIAVWFAVPIIDCLRLLAARISRGQSPFAGDRDHLHHHLAKLFPNWIVGWSFYMLLVTIPSYMATIWPYLSVYCLVGVTLANLLIIVITSNRFQFSKS